MLTPLARNLLLALCSPILLYVLGLRDVRVPLWAVLLPITLSASIFFVPSPKQKSLTILDRVMVNLDRILQRKTPCAGQIDTILNVKQAPARDAVVDGLQELAQLKRFHSRAVRSASVLQSAFEPALPLDYSYHVVLHEVEDEAAVEKLMEKLCNTDLSFDHPLWRIDVVKNTSGQSAIILRMNHAIGDGLRLVKASSKLLKFADGSAATLELLSKMSQKRQTTLETRRPPLSLLLQAAKDLVEIVLGPHMPNETPSSLRPKNGALFDAGAWRSCHRATLPFATVKQATL